MRGSIHHPNPEIHPIPLIVPRCCILRLWRVIFQFVAFNFWRCGVYFCKFECSTPGPKTPIQRCFAQKNNIDSHNMRTQLLWHYQNRQTYWTAWSEVIQYSVIKTVVKLECMYVFTVRLTCVYRVEDVIRAPPQLLRIISAVYLIRAAKDTAADEFSDFCLFLPNQPPNTCRAGWVFFIKICFCETP